VKQLNSLPFQQFVQVSSVAISSTKNM